MSLLCNSCNNPVHCTHGVVTSKLLGVMKECDSDVQNTPSLSAAILSAKPDLGGDV